MTNRPAYEEVEIAIGTAAVRLRPSLRAAISLEREFGLPGLVQHVMQCNVGSLAKIIRESAVDRQAAERVIASFGRVSVSQIADASTEPLFRLINCFVPRRDKSQGEATGKPMPWAEFYRELFRLGTGWLGWSAKATWNATPAEISDAFEGLHAKLKAIHGSGEPTEDEPQHYTADQIREIEEQGFDPAFDRAGLASLRASTKRAANA